MEYLDLPWVDSIIWHRFIFLTPLGPKIQRCSVHRKSYFVELAVRRHRKTLWPIMYHVMRKIIDTPSDNCNSDFNFFKIRDITKKCIFQPISKISEPSIHFSLQKSVIYEIKLGVKKFQNQKRKTCSVRSTPPHYFPSFSLEMKINWI